MLSALCAVLIAGCASQASNSKSEKTIHDDWAFRPVNLDIDFVVENAREIAGTCRTRNELITLRDKRVLCINGEISEKTVELSESKKFEIAYIRSPGGGNLQAMDVGRQVAKNAAILIVNEHCHSACANYIVPASRRLYMMDNTVISMHGFPPRQRIRRAIRIMRGKGMSPTNTPNFTQMAIKEALKWEEYDDRFTIPEVRYFSAMAVNEAYITRFDEIVRTLNNRENYICGRIDGRLGLNLIVGPKYLREFRIKTIREWFPENLSEYVSMKPKSSTRAAFIFDFDESPFWVPEKGLVTPADCHSEG